MASAVYCLCSSEVQANTILTRLRTAGFASEISLLMQDQPDTRDISATENAVRGVEVGGIVGALLALTIPGIGIAMAVGPLVAALAGAAAGGAVGGLAGGSGALTFKPLNLPDEVADRIHRSVAAGDILIAVHSHNSTALQTARGIFEAEGAGEIFESHDKAA